MSLGIKLVVAFLMVLLVALQLRLWSSDGGLFSVSGLERLIGKQRQQNARMLARNRILMAEVRDLRKGNDAIEERARSDLGMIRDDEQFYLAIGRHP